MMIRAAEIGIWVFAAAMTVFSAYAFLAAGRWLPRMRVEGTLPQMNGVVHFWAGLIAAGFALMTTPILYRGDRTTVWAIVLLLWIGVIASIVQTVRIDRRTQRDDMAGR